jgi:hypothetical protein
LLEAGSQRPASKRLKGTSLPHHPLPAAGSRPTIFRCSPPLAVRSAHGVRGFAFASPTRRLV